MERLTTFPDNLAKNDRQVSALEVLAYQEAEELLRRTLGHDAINGVAGGTAFETLAKSPDAQEVNELRQHPGRSSGTYTMPEGSDPPAFEMN